MVDFADGRLVVLRGWPGFFTVSFAHAFQGTGRQRFAFGGYGVCRRLALGNASRGLVNVCPIHTKGTLHGDRLSEHSGRIFIDFLCLNGFDCGHRISVDASPHTWKYRGLGDFRMPFGSGFCWRVDLRGAELQPEP